MRLKKSSGRISTKLLISSPTIQTMRTKVIRGTHTPKSSAALPPLSLDRDISGLHQFCSETFQLYSCGKEVDFKDGLIPLIEYHKRRSLDIWLNVKLRGGVDRDEMKAVIWRFADTLSKTADRIRSNINIIPLQSNYYPKQWAVKMVMNRDIYASDQKAIKDMIAKKQISPSSGALLLKLVQYERSNILFVHDEW
eukprot:scaffold213235_cov66-Cyclotella_meneghiniana.AAC.2